MANRSLNLNRRTFLRGAGVVCALPYLEAMGVAQEPASAGAETEAEYTGPRRMGFVYFPNGCSLPGKDDEENKQWRWFPHEGETPRDYELTNVLASLAPFREDLSILGGLSHPKSRELLGHIAGDTWLTGGDVRTGAYRNTISVDQVARHSLKKHTRYPSLVLSTDGGVGYKSRVSTLSFDDNGRPVPAECRPREIFERYFAPDAGGTTAERRRSLRRGQKVVDLVLEDAKRLLGRLGKHDAEKMEQYLGSVSAVEEQIRRDEEWLDVPRKAVDSSALELDVLAKVDPTKYLRTMLDLMVIGWQTDATRVITFMMGREDGMGFGDNFPKLSVGLNKGHHTISHDNIWHEWGPFDRWYAEQFAYLVERMRDTTDEHGSLLDSTMLLYGSCCSTTHNARNYPLALAGGGKLGLRHGGYHVYDDTTPLANLFVGMLNAVGVPTERFADSTGNLTEVFA